MDKLVITFEKENDGEGNHWWNSEMKCGRFFRRGNFTIIEGKAHWEPEEKDGTDYDIFWNEKEIIELIGANLDYAIVSEEEIN